LNFSQNKEMDRTPVKSQKETPDAPIAAASSDSFQMIYPQEKKRQQILAVAKKETDMYNKYLQENKLNYVHETHYLGGISVLLIVYQ
jgi:hypothetical protein